MRYSTRIAPVPSNQVTFAGEDLTRLCRNQKRDVSDLAFCHRRFLRLGLVLTSAFLVHVSIEFPAFGQGKSSPKKGGVNLEAGGPKGLNQRPGTKGGGAKGPKRAGAAEEVNEKPLEEIDFSAAHKSLLEDGAVKELDETREGKARLREVTARAKGVFKERLDLESERRPLAVARDTLLGEVFQLNQVIDTNQRGIQQAQNRIRLLQGMLNNANSEQVEEEIQNLQNQIADANRIVVRNQSEVAERTPEINALNQQIIPLDLQLVKLWLELNESRKQWLEIRQPQQKYAYGNYEGLKEVIDDWVLIDGLWPEAFCWAALCQYELGNYEAAWEHIERATELRQSLRLPKPWAQGDALRGLISAKIPERRGKSANFLLSAGTAVNKDKSASWVVLFVLGRAACETEKTEAKAKTYFERSLKLKGDSDCVKYWLGHLQSTSTTATVQDPAAAVKTLEEIWQRSTKQSWRLAHQLVLAYDVSKREAEAQATWKLVEKLAPQDQLEALQADRNSVKSKPTSGAGAEANPKSKSSKKAD